MKSDYFGSSIKPNYELSVNEVLYIKWLGFVNKNFIINLKESIHQWYSEKQDLNQKQDWELREVPPLYTYVVR